MRKTWLKVICYAVSAVLLTAILSGCGGGQKPSETKPAVEKKTKVVWWTHQRHDMDYMQAMIAKFMQENPNIEIEYNIQTQNYPQNLELAFQSGQSPDIFSLRDTAKYYVDRKMIEPLDKYLTDDIKKRYDNFLKSDIENYVDGKIYSLANGGVTIRLIYNKELFKKANLPGPPKSLDEMVEYAKKITEVGKSQGAYGFAVNMKNPYSAFWRSLDQIGFRSGIYPYDFKTGKYDFMTMKPIIQAYKKMYDDKSMFPGIEGLDIDPLRSQFAEGKIGMYISGNWEVGVYAQQFPAKIDWGAAPVPAVKGEVKGTTEVANAGKWIGISSKSQNKDAAWKVFNWFHRDEVLKEYHEKGYGFSVVPSVVKIAKDSDAKGVQDFKLTKGIDSLWPASPHKQSMKIEGKTMHDVYAAIILGQAKMDEGLADLNKRYTDALEKAVKEGKVDKIVIPGFDPLKQ